MVNMLNNTNRRYFYFLIRSHTRMMILYGLALFISFPILVLSLYNTASVEGLYYTGKTLNLILLVAATIFIPLIMFKYTTEKSSLDVYHALPIKKESLFRLHYCAGMVFMLLPFTLSWFSGIIVSYVLGYLQMSLGLEILRFFQLMFGIFVCYNLTVFVKKNCGTIFDSFLYTIALHLIPILAYTAIYGYLYTVLFGFNEPFSTDLSYYLTPVYSVFMYGLFARTTYVPPVPNSVMIFQAIQGIVLFLAASHLYQKLKSEKTNIPFVIRFFYPLVSAVATINAIILIHVIMDGLFEYSGLKTFIFPILVGGLFYLFLDVIANRGFKHFIKALLQLSVLCVITLSILLPIKYSRGFGYVTRVPDVDQVETVKVSVNYPFFLGFSVFSSNYNDTFAFSDPQVIEAVTAAHQRIVNEAAKYGYERNTVNRNIYSSFNGYPDTTWVSIEYDLGLTKLKRSYSIPIDWLQPIADLAGLDEMDQAQYPMLYHPQEYVISQMQISDALDTTRNVISEKHTALFEALAADLKDESVEDYRNTAHKIVGYLSFDFEKSGDYGRSTIRIPIKEQYATTLSYLTSKNIQIPNINWSALQTADVYAIYPNTNENRPAFFYYEDQTTFSHGRYLDIYNFNYKNVTAAEFEQLVPYLHRTNATKEANLIVVVSNEEKDQLQTYFISYKDLELVNTIVTSELQNEPNGIYSLISYK